MRLLVKVGGAQLEDAGARADLVRSIANARARGHEVVLVHGGGSQIHALAKRLGLEQRTHEGLRVTDRDTAEVVLMVLAGLVNKELAAAFEAQGVRAVGLCGVDGSTFSAVKLRPGGGSAKSASLDLGPEARSVDLGPEALRADARNVDLGYVGKVARVDPRLLETLLAQGYVPLIATAAPLAQGESDPRDRFYNVNADLAAGPLARAIGAAALIFLTDVPGVLDGQGERLAQLSPHSCAELRASGVVRGGMIPKVDAALAALAENPSAIVKIAPAAGPDSVLAALETDVGTRFISELEGRLGGPTFEGERQTAWTNTY